MRKSTADGLSKGRAMNLSPVLFGYKFKLAHYRISLPGSQKNGNLKINQGLPVSNFEFRVSSFLPIDFAAGGFDN